MDGCSQAHGSASGQDVEAYLAVAGIGVQPNVELAEGTAGRDRQRHPGGRALPHVRRRRLRGRDVARFPDAVARHPRRIEHWSNAHAQGAYLGRVLAGSRAPYDEVAVFFTQLFDVKLQVLGDLDGGVDGVVLIGSVAERRVLGFYLRDGRVVGAVLTGQAADVVERVKEVVREQPEADDPEALLADPRWRTATVT